MEETLTEMLNITINYNTMEHYFEETDLDIDFGEDFNSEDLPEENKEEVEEKKQRTEKWRSERLGCLTGSKGALIMKCNRQGSKLSWNDKRKIFEFSESIIPYIYECVMERKTGRYIESPSSLPMKYGTAVEPLIQKRILEYLQEKELTFKEVGFKKFNDIPTAGASADGVIYDKKELPVMVGEFKACTNWGTHYKRTYEKTDESSMDFWQMIIEMSVWGVNKALYVVISPPNNILRYINEPDIMDAYDDFIKETEMHIEELSISEVHIEAFNQRLSIIESVIQKHMNTGNRIDELLEQELLFHKNKLLGMNTDYFEEVEKNEEPKQIKEKKQDTPEIDFENSIF